MRKYIFYTILAWFLMGTHIVYAKPKNTIPDSLQVLRFEVNTIPFSMQRVEGGLFVMGGTREQHREEISTELPTHAVALDAYYIGHTEVTQALWQAVMPEWEMIGEWQNPNHPITDVSWYDCQVFLQRLDSITGLPFRLPTEAEWEFAARGGNDSEKYRFAGGNIPDSVGWGLSNAGFRKHTVGLKKPNELGLYDMTGNVSEWCNDWYAPYYLGTEPNPKGPITGSDKIVRGGSFDNCQANSHISYRYFQKPEETTKYCGLRLALTLPNEPTLQLTEEPAIVKRVKAKNYRLKLLYVENEQQAYYISERPVTWQMWYKIMELSDTENWNKPVVEKESKEWDILLEKIRKQTQQPIAFATQAEVDKAIDMGIVDKFTVEGKKKKRWEKDTQSIKRRRKTNQKAQKWADLVGVTLKTIEDPTLELYTKEEKNNQPRWLVIR